VAETYDRIWVGGAGGAPQINAAVDFRGVEVYVGCVLEQRIPAAPRRVDLGQYDSAETAARVRDQVKLADLGRQKLKNVSEGLVRMLSAK